MTKDNKVKYILFDARGEILGRLAVRIAKVLSGKTKVDYQPNKGGSDWAIVINAKDVMLTAKKPNQKNYWKHSGYPGGVSSIKFKDLIKKDPQRVITLAVKGMLPKNKLSSQALKRLRVFADDKHVFGNRVVPEDKK